MPTKQKKQRQDEPSKQMRRYVDNRAEGMNKKESAIKAGYSKSSANAVKPVIEETKTYEKLLQEYLPDSLILGALRDDIESKPSYRAAELNLATKIKGFQTDRIDITSGGQVIKGFIYQKPQENKALNGSKSSNKAKDE